MDQKKKLTKNDWVKCQSKSRPGRYYLFNKNTGETKWYNPEEEARKLNKLNSLQKTDDNQKSKLDDTLPYKESTKQMRTPAQDRLKRLQSKMKSEQRKSKDKAKLERNNNKCNAENKNSVVGPAKYTSKMKKGSLEEDEDEDENSPTTSTNALVKSKTLPIENEQSKKTNTTILVKKKTSTKRTLRKRALNLVVDTPELHIKMIKRNEIEMPKAIEAPLETRESTISTSWSYGSGIVGKITEICKNTLKSATKALEGRTRLLGKSNTKIPKLDNTAESAAGTSDAPTASITKKIVEYTPKRMHIPSYDRGSANTRLQQLRQSLRLQQNSNENVLLKRTPNNPNANVFDEPMDWQSIDDNSSSSNDNKFIRTDNVDMLTLYTNKALVKSTVPSCLVPASRSLMEFHDTVNENLMRLAAVKQRTVKWLENHYYFVIDTNVLLRQLTFVDDLSKMQLCDTSGTIIYVPYIVLQELDKLKQRAYNEGAKTLAVRAIKYLNQQFEANNERFQAQSASEECKHLIEVESPDDSIINCCLQVYEHVPQVILLTEDVNLRTKAHCNDLLVSTKAELLSRQASNSITISTATATYTSNNISTNE